MEGFIMNDTMQFPTTEEADRISAEFDVIVQHTFDELTRNGVRVRTDVVLRSRNEGLSSPVRVGASLFVSRAIQSDPDVVEYDDPSEAQLREILARAERYTGDWYHSKVTLHYTGHWTPLQTEVAELDEESGVFVIFDYDSPEALSSHLSTVL
jgi:hypothetical protein